MKIKKIETTLGALIEDIYFKLQDFNINEHLKKQLVATIVNDIIARNNVVIKLKFS